MEQFIQTLLTLDPTLVLAVVFAFALLENLFPPLPSDLAIVAAASLVGLGRLSFVELLLIASFGSTIGFLIMYGVGNWFGRRILDSGKVRFLPISAVRRVEAWFAKYGLWLIVANRFLTGTRAVVSFFAGLSEMRLLLTLGLSFVSSLAWNAVLVSAGYALGSNWERIGFYLSAYSQVVTGILIVVTIVLIARAFLSNGSQSASGGQR